MSLISKIKVNYLEKKVKAKTAGSVNVSGVQIPTSFLNSFEWLKGCTGTMDDTLFAICSALDLTMTQVAGKLSSGSFYGVQSISGSTITYKTGAETPSAAKLYIDINDGNKLYRYDSGTSAYVQIALSAS